MPKKKRATDKEKKPKKKCLNERETLSYEQQIIDNNRQLARLRTRNEELENEMEIIKHKLQQLEEDRSDIVAHLKRNLEEKIEETRELNERLLALEELRKEELIACKKREETMELEYRTMESNLSAEVKLAAGKLNALEDWRLARLDLMHKFEVQEAQMAEQEERHKQTLYEAEKTIIIGKAKMQREMEERLKELTQSFKDAMNIRIADATHRAIRENIILNQELDLMFEVCRNLEMKTRECKETERVLRLESDLFDTEAKIALDKTLKQKQIIQDLVQSYVDMNLAYGEIQRENVRIASYEKLHEEYKAKCIAAEKEIKILKQHLQQSKNERKQIIAKIRNKYQQFDKLSNILNEAKKCITEALQLQEKVSAEDVCYIDIKEKFLYSLLNILEQESIPCILKDLTSQNDEIKCEYVEETKLLQHPEYKETVHETDEHIIDEQGYIEKELNITEIEKSASSTKVQRDIPSCLLSDTSSDIVSPQETVTTPSINNFA